MAAVVNLLGTATFNTTSGSKTVTTTPAVNDLIVIVTAHTGNTSTAAPTDNNSGGGGTYTLVNTAVKASSADTMKIWVRNALVTSATSTVFTHAPGTSTGGGLVVLKVQNMQNVGSAAFVKSAIQSNQASGTPAPVFASAPKASNPIIGAVFNASNIAGLTPRSGYDEEADLGYNTPTTGLHVMAEDSGETSATITWGSSSSAFGSIVVELDAIITQISNSSLAGAGTVSFSGTRKQQGATSLSAAGTLAANYIWRQNYDGNRVTEQDDQRITEAGDIRVTEKFVEGLISLTGTGSLTSSAIVYGGVQTWIGDASFTGTGSLEAQGSPIRYGIGSFTATGTASYTPTLKLNGANTFTSTGTISSTGIIRKIVLSNLNATGTLSSSASRTTYGSVDGTGQGSKLAAGVRTVFGVVDLHGVHSGTFTPTLKLKGTLAATAVGTLSSTAKLKASGASSRTGTGTLYAFPITGKQTGESSLSSAGTLSAKAFDSTMYVKVGSSWKTSIPYVKHNSTWKQPLAIYKKVSGNWTKVY